MLSDIEVKERIEQFRDLISNKNICKELEIPLPKTNTLEHFDIFEQPIPVKITDISSALSRDEICEAVAANIQRDRLLFVRKKLETHDWYSEGEVGIGVYENGLGYYLLTWQSREKFIKRELL